MFKTTLIAAIALAGAQAIKISSQATSETSAELPSYCDPMHPETCQALRIYFDDGKNYNILTRDVDLDSDCNHSGQYGC